jgi:hypothetical protein
MIGRCDICNKWKIGIQRHSVTIGPGHGKVFHVCAKCPVPPNFNDLHGISQHMKSNAKFVRFVGEPIITNSMYGNNAYGSILALYDDGSKTGVICGHGGSAWLCLACAKEAHKAK